MKLVLSGSTIKKLNAFTSKETHRYIFQSISFKKVNDKLEIVATDGSCLIRMVRPFEENEVLDKDILLKIPSKVKVNKNYTLQEKNGMYVLGNEDEQLLCEVIEGAYPKYETCIFNDMDKLVQAKKFAFFKSGAIKNLELALCDYVRSDIPFPQVKGEEKAHFFTKTIGDTTIDVVLMPIRL